jgi:outer membrane protein assembly factor BamB
MKTFQCSACGHLIERPTQPLKCPQCGRQAIGLFKAVQGGPQTPAPQAPQAPQQGAHPPQQPGGYAPQPPAPPSYPGSTPSGAIPVPRGGVSPISAPPPPPGAVRPVQPAPGPAAPMAPQGPYYGGQATGYPPAQPSSPSTPQVARPAPQQPAQWPPPQTVPPQTYQPTYQAPAQPPAEPPPQPVQPQAYQPLPPTPQQPAPQQPPQKSRAAPPPLPGSKPEASQPRSRSKDASRRPAQAAAPPTGRGAAARPSRPSAPAPAPVPKPEPPKPRPKIRPKVLRPKEFVWAFPGEPPYEDEARVMRNAPAVDPQGRFILYHQGRLLALVEEQDQAKTVWEYVIGSHVPGPIAVASDGTIRAHCNDGYLHCLNSAGRQEWSPVKVGEPLGFAAPVVDEEGSTYVSSYDGGLLLVDREGRVAARHYFRSRRKLDSAGIIHAGVLYVGSEDGYVFAIQLGPRRGENLWNPADEQGHTGWFVNSSPALAADGTIVVAARDETLYGFHPDGHQTWAAKMPGQMLGSPVIDRQGHLYVGVFQAHRGQEGRGFLVCIDGNSHKVRWRYDAAAPVESTPVIGDDDLVYFGDNSGTIHAVDPQGKAQWTARVEAAVRSAGTILAPGRLAFGLDDDTLVVLRCSSQGLAPEGWPKIGRTLGQSGL